jgi:hypothetical protein
MAGQAKNPRSQPQLPDVAHFPSQGAAKAAWAKAMAVKLAALRSIISLPFVYQSPCILYDKVHGLCVTKSMHFVAQNEQADQS